MHVTLEVSQIVTLLIRSTASLNIIVVPAESLARLNSRQESSFGKVESHSGQDTTADEVHGVVVRQVHGGPPHPESISNEERLEFGKHVAHEESSKGGISCVKRWESTKHDGRGVETRGVEIDAEQSIDTSQSSWIAFD